MSNVINATPRLFWRSLAIEAGEAVADTLVRRVPRFSDDAANALLERSGERLCTCMLEAGCSDDQTIQALDAMAAAFAARLEALEAALAGPGGQA